MQIEKLHSERKVTEAQARQELEKVFRLRSRGIPIEVFSLFIDDVWHTMLENEATYIDFCMKSCGSIIGHEKGEGYGVVTFVSTYEREFGPLPEIWFADRSGTVDRDTYLNYLRTGEVRASWKCTPTHACMAKIAPPAKPSAERRKERERPQSKKTGRKGKKPPTRKK